MPIVTITGQETPAENIPKSMDAAEASKLDTFTRERRIWPGSHIYLECFKNQKMLRTKVWEGDASDAVSLNLDPGWYRYKCTNTDEFGDHRQFINQFLVQITVPMFRRYAAMKPVYSKGRQTSDGIRWTCGFPNCRKSFTSSYGIVDHEKRHQGETVFKDAPWEPERNGDVLTSHGIVILGGPPEGVDSAPERREAVLPPPVMQSIEEERTKDVGPPGEAPKPKKRGRPKGSTSKRKEEPVGV